MSKPESEKRPDEVWDDQAIAALQKGLEEQKASGQYKPALPRGNAPPLAPPPKPKRPEEVWYDEMRKARAEALAYRRAKGLPPPTLAPLKPRNRISWWLFGGGGGLSNGGLIAIFLVCCVMGWSVSGAAPIWLMPIILIGGFAFMFWMFRP